MCDTMMATADRSRDGATLFGKNSDRERNEAQLVEILPRRRYRAGARLRLTHVEIDQARETHAVLLSRPYWMWGAEIGANEHGVVIGNEAVFAKRMPSPSPGVLGMDHLRLGLERAASADEALDVMTKLLERHGQGGNCGHALTRTYHNSYIIADAAGGWVLETVGRDWVAERVRGVRTISNALSIGARHDRIAAPLAARLDGAPVAATLTNPRRDGLSQGHQRCARSATMLGRAGDSLDIHAIMSALRDHGPKTRRWHPDQTETKAICMHAAWGGSGGQTTGAMASWLKRGRRPVHWVTGSAAPCLSVFKPLFVDLGLPARERAPTGRFDPRTRWWRHERLHRAVLEDYAARAAVVAAERDAMEAGFVARVAAVVDADAAARRRVVAACWAEADAAEARWLAAVSAMPVAARAALGYRRAWSKFNRAAAFPAPAVTTMAAS
ncbi:MAG: C69 family dipeptidase [Rhodospirillales bacterium]|nr:MAG: C69 family dipeptidase [Rhodospirillales bacterium]